MATELPAGMKGIISAIAEKREPTDEQVAAAVTDVLILVWHLSFHLERIADALEKH